MELREFSVVPCEFGRLKSRAGIGEEGPVHERDPEGGAGDAEVLHHALDVLGPEEFGERSPSGRRIRMDLHSPPLGNEFELALQLFDDAFADVAEGSDVIGEDAHPDRHGFSSVKRPKQNSLPQRHWGTEKAKQG